MDIPVPPNIKPAADVPAKLPPPSFKQGYNEPHPLEPYRSKDVVRKDEPDPYGTFIKLLDSLGVKWKAGAPHKVLSSINKRAAMLGWDSKALKVVEEMTGLTTTLPRRCPGRVKISTIKSMSAESQTCPCSHFYGNDPDVWKGCICPGEAVRAYRHFVRYVRELDIHEADTVDISLVMDIIQLHLIEDRCNENIQISGLFEDTGKLIQQSTGTIHFDRKASEAIALKEKCQKQRLELYSKLMVTRDQREKLRATRVKEKQEDKKGEAFNNLADLFSMIKSNTKPIPILGDNDEEIVEGDFGDDNGDTED